MLSPLLAFIAFGLGTPQEADPNLERRWFSRDFGPEYTASVFEGNITRLSLHRPGFTMGERPGLELVEAKTPSGDWSKRFRAALLDVRHHEWQVRFTNRFQTDAVVRLRTGSQTCDVQFSFQTDEIRFWSDVEGSSPKQSIRPGREVFLNLLAEAFPSLRNQPKERPELVEDRRFDGLSSERREQNKRKRKAGLGGALSHEWIVILSAPDRIIAQRMVGEPRVPTGKPIQATEAWAGRFFQAMSNRDNIGWGGETNCGFRPDVSLKFERGAQTLTVQLCFGCNDLMVADVDPPHSGKRLPFKPGRPIFLTLARQLFPTDEGLASYPIAAK